jgi:hypothetical protein
MQKMELLSTKIKNFIRKNGQDISVYIMNGISHVSLTGKWAIRRSILLGRGAGRWAFRQHRSGGMTFCNNCASSTKQLFPCLWQKAAAWPPLFFSSITQSQVTDYIYRRYGQVIPNEKEGSFWGKYFPVLNEITDPFDQPQYCFFTGYIYTLVRVYAGKNAEVIY